MNFLQWLDAIHFWEWIPFVFGAFFALTGISLFSMAIAQRYSGKWSRYFYRSFMLCICCTLISFVAIIAFAMVEVMI